jgi:tRNA pseudouridine32 synthase/23S rRNA pseudouridine746 synthase
MLHPLHTDITPPERFTYPFCYEPHPLCRLAAAEVQRHLQTMTLTEGKMFGVLVVSTPDGAPIPDAAPTPSGAPAPSEAPTPDDSSSGSPSGPYSFLAAYSGLLEGRNDWPYFVPPVFDAQQPDGHFKQTERIISIMRDDSQRDERRQMSQELQQWLFRHYRVLNAHGEAHDLIQVWQDYHCSERIRRRFPMPPGGTGDCCAPKLLQYAYQQGLKPLCMAEFWWGPSPRSEVRHHGQFYPACRGKCKPVLTWMLQGLDVDPSPDADGFPKLDIDIVYEDDVMAVVNKPSGLLSVPGRTEYHSVATIVQQRWEGALLVHRLDMWTSGLLVVAKNRDVYRQLQRQFAERAVRKRYVALLDDTPSSLPQKGTISLPLYADPLNRPRQVVDYQLGKPAVTDYELLNTPSLRRGQGEALIAIYPHTGRTHQLRLHCAHKDGLGCPIRGDELYGRKADRLYLHAEQLWLTHPVTGQPMHFEQPAPF